jgi:hypothetical protein
MSEARSAFRAARQLSAMVAVCQSTPKNKKEGNDGKAGKTKTRAMWMSHGIMAVLVILLILAGMGWNMWIHADWAHGDQGRASKTQLVCDRNAALDWTMWTQGRFDQ